MRRFAPPLLAFVFGVLTLSSAALAADNFEVLLAELEIIPLPAAAAPQFKLDTLDGKPLALGDIRGRPALLYFWATW